LSPNNASSTISALVLLTQSSKKKKKRKMIFCCSIRPIVNNNKTLLSLDTSSIFALSERNSRYYRVISGIFSTEGTVDIDLCICHQIRLAYNSRVLNPALPSRYESTWKGWVKLARVNLVSLGDKTYDS
jgi:hypothetical protein